MKMRPVHPRSRVRRPIVEHHHRSGTGGGIDQHRDEFFARFVKPMQVFDNNDGGRHSCLADNAGNRVQQPGMSGLGVEDRRRPVWIRNAQKIAEKRQIGLECRIERQQPLPDPVPGRGRVIDRGNAKEQAQKFQHRLQWRRVAVDGCAGLEHGDPARATPLGKLVAQTALSRSWRRGNA